MLNVYTADSTFSLPMLAENPDTTFAPYVYLCEFNYAHEILLNIAHAELTPRREGDRSIMAEA
jgi:hypothetical protein